MNTINPSDAYTDLSGLDHVRKQSREDPSKALDEVAKQFEGMFLNMVLKSMREASLADGLFSSNAVETHQQMYDAQLALHLAGGDRLGFAKALKNQLAPMAGIRPEGDGAQPTVDPLINRQPLPPLFAGASVNSTAGSHPAETVKRPDAPASTSDTDRRFTSPADFVRELMPAARAAASRLGVAPEVLVAQAAHETGWGRHIPEKADGQSSHNLFGIKAGSSWDGDRVNKSTFEVVDGLPRRQRADFRAYDSFEACLRDYARVIQGQDRYTDALAHAGSASGYLQGLQSGGYATDPQYAEKIGALLNSERFRDAVEQTRASALRADSGQGTSSENREWHGS
ncbi:MAG: flagellar assembly peptidoglycan hydrolase FlgJ [Gammaproteobacteria bacterium]